MKISNFAILLSCLWAGLAISAPSISSSNADSESIPHRVSLIFGFKKNDTIANNCPDVYGIVSLGMTPSGDHGQIIFHKSSGQSVNNVCSVEFNELVVTRPVSENHKIRLSYEFRDADDSPDPDDYLCGGGKEIFSDSVHSLGGECKELTVTITPILISGLPNGN